MDGNNCALQQGHRFCAPSSSSIGSIRRGPRQPPQGPLAPCMCSLACTSCPCTDEPTATTAGLGYAATAVDTASELWLSFFVAWCTAWMHSLSLYTWRCGTSCADLSWVTWRSTWQSLTSWCIHGPGSLIASACTWWWCSTATSQTVSCLSCLHGCVHMHPAGGGRLGTAGA
jgi:hypothetical protein